MTHAITGDDPLYLGDDPHYYLGDDPHYYWEMTHITTGDDPLYLGDDPHFCTICMSRDIRSFWTYSMRPIYTCMLPCMRNVYNYVIFCF